MQTKATVRYHCKYTRIAKIKKTDNIKSWPESGETRFLMYCGNVNCYNLFGKKILAISTEAEHIHALLLSSSTSKYIANRNTCTSVNKFIFF